MGWVLDYGMYGMAWQGAFGEGSNENMLNITEKTKGGRRSKCEKQTNFNTHEPGNFGV